MAACPIRKNDDTRTHFAQHADDLHTVFVVFSTRPSGMSSACRQLTPRIFAASAASAARSSAEPRVPASPCVRSRMAVRHPSAFIFRRVPPHVCSTSSRCAATARMSAIEFSGMSLRILKCRRYLKDYRQQKFTAAHSLSRCHAVAYAFPPLRDLTLYGHSACAAPKSSLCANQPGLDRVLSAAPHYRKRVLRRKQGPGCFPHYDPAGTHPDQ